MFDANMRTIPKDREFFMKIYYFVGVEKIHPNLQQNRIYLCRMISPEECEDRMVEIIVDRNTSIFIKYLDYFYEKLFIYEGRVDGRSFISQDSKVTAMKILEDLGRV